MTDNVKFNKLRRWLASCSTEAEKAEIYRQMLDLNPSYPPLRQQQAEFRRELENIGRKGSSRQRREENVYDIPRHPLQIGLVGAGNSGKSTLLCALTDATPEVTDYPFATRRPVIGNLEINDVATEVVEIPSLKEGDALECPAKYRLVRRMRELVVVVADPREVGMVEGELKAAGIEMVAHTQPRCEERNRIPNILAYRGERLGHPVLSSVDVNDIASLLGQVYIGLHIQRIYARTEAAVERSPVVFLGDEAVTVERFAERLDRRLLGRYRGARIWGPSAHHDGQHVGLKHAVVDGDSVYLVRA